MRLSPPAWRCLALAPHGTVAYAAHAEPPAARGGGGVTVRAWHLARGACVWAASLPAPLVGLAASHDGAVVFAACDGAADVVVLRAADGARLAPLGPTCGCAEPSNARITSLALSADGAVLAVARGQRVDAYDIPRGEAHSWPLTPLAPTASADARRPLTPLVPTASADALFAHPGARIRALAVSGTGTASSRSVFAAWDEGVLQLALARGGGTAPPLRSLRCAGLRSLACVRTFGQGRLLLYGGGSSGVYAWHLAGDASDTDAASADVLTVASVLPPGDAAAGAGVLALAAGGLCCAATGGAALVRHAPQSWYSGTEEPHAHASTFLLAGACEAFVALAASPCGGVVVAAAAAPRGCVLRRFVLAPPRCFARAHGLEAHTPPLRAAVRAFLRCVASPGAAPHALAMRLDAASLAGILDAIFSALVAAVARDTDADAAAAPPLLRALIVEAVPLPRARDCARGLVLFHAAAEQC